MTSDDCELMRRVQAGEFGCFDLLVERYRAALVRVATGMLADEALAEDVVQETLLAVFAARHTYQPALHFRTWLWTILINFCRRQRARRGRQPQPLARSDAGKESGPDIAALAGAANSETALATLLRREQSAQLQRLLNELPDVQSDAIRLRFYGGLTYDEIARSMGVSLGGAKLRVRTGLEKLSRFLRRDAGLHGDEE